MTVNHTETVRCKKTITTDIQLLATGSRKSRYENKQVGAEKQHDSHTSSILPCSARPPLNAVYSESRDVFKFLHVLAMICLYRETGKRVDSHVQCKSSKILVAFITRHAGGKTLQDLTKCRIGGFLHPSIH